MLILFEYELGGLMSMYSHTIVAVNTHEINLSDCETNVFKNVFFS